MSAPYLRLWWDDDKRLAWLEARRYRRAAKALDAALMARAKPAAYVCATRPVGWVPASWRRP